MAANRPAFWQSLSDRYQRASGREKVLIVVAMLALLIGLWDSLAHRPLQQRIVLAKQQASQAQQQVEPLQQMISKLQHEVGETTAAKRQRLVQLQQSIQSTQQQLRADASGLVTPQQMANVLKQLLQQSGRLELIKLQTLKPQTWPESIDPKATDSDSQSVFKHGIELELQGEFFAILDYIKQVEKQPGFDWDLLDYQVQIWPQARVLIRLHTLGLDEAFVGA